MQWHAGGVHVVVGTLDVIVTTAVEGEFLRGHDKDAAYMINVCVANVVRRRSIGKQLVQAAIETALGLGVNNTIPGFVLFSRQAVTPCLLLSWVPTACQFVQESIHCMCT